MKVVRSARLWMKEGSSDKVYEVDLVDLEHAGLDERYLVNIRYGRRGGTLRDGTKTPAAVARSNADKLFDSVVVSKVNDGYRRIDGDAPPLSAPSTDAAASGGRDAELLRKLATSARSPFPDKNRDRLFWRLGVIRLTSAYPQLAAFAEKLGAANVSYSLVHALARCGGADASEALRQIAEANDSVVTRDYAAYALASGLMGERRQPPRLSLPRATDAAAMRDIDAALAAGNGAALVQALLAASSTQANFANQFLIALAHHAHADAKARATLLTALRAVSARPPFVQVLRRLFKYADLTDDGPLFAATARQFELATPMYRTGRVYNDRVWIPGSRQALMLSEEQRSATPRIALSDQTLLYFKRRAWRMLRKRAELGQDAFTAMAGDLLLAFTDADGAPRTWTAYERVNGRYQSVPNSANALSRVWSVSHLLHENGATSRFNTKSLTHRHVGTPDLMRRDEAFPALWNAQPERLLHIAAAARNHPSAAFAAAALKQGPTRPDAMDAAAMPGLLTSPYPEVGSLATAIARRLITEGKADGALVAALLDASVQELRDLGTRAIDNHTDWPWSDAGLAGAAMMSPYDDVQGKARQWLQDRPPSLEQRTRMTEAFAAWLARLPAELDAPLRSSLQAALALLPLLWPDHDCPLQPQLIENLTGHPSPDVQAASIQLIAVTPTRPDQLPAPFWQAILQSTSPEIRVASMSLLGRLDSTALAAHGGNIVLAAVGDDARLRAAARPLVVRLAAADDAFAIRLRDLLMTSFFRAEPSEGHAPDMVRLFVEGLPQATAAIDDGTLWRLLQARATGARLFGARILETSAPSRLSVRQLARLGNHPFAAVRRYALHAFTTDETRFRADPQNAVLLVESEWDDVRSVAVSRLTAWPSEDLPAAALAVMADSTVPAVQDGARQLLRRSLGEGDVAEVLGRVLEHPSGSFHLFVTELITGQALSDPAVFDKFLTQARIILMQINRGRVAKDRIFAALRSEALGRKERAVAISRLLHDLTLSVIISDKAPALLILRDIARAWPDIALPIAVTRTSRPPSNGGAQTNGSAA